MRNTDNGKQVVHISETKLAEIAVEVARRMLKEGYNQFTDGEGLDMTSFEEPEGMVGQNISGTYRYPGKIFDLPGYVNVVIYDCGNNQGGSITFKDVETGHEYRSIQGCTAGKLIMAMKEAAWCDEDLRYYIASKLETYYNNLRRIG